MAKSRKTTTAPDAAEHGAAPRAADYPIGGNAAGPPILEKARKARGASDYPIGGNAAGPPILEDARKAASAEDLKRALNQNEIDKILGFDNDGAEGPDNSGIRAIVNSTVVSYERLPMLEIVLDRLVRLMTTSLRNFTSDNVEVDLDNITSIRFGDYLDSIAQPAILAIFRARQLDNYGLVTVDSNLVYSMVDVLLGGRRGAPAMRIEGRPYTVIERTLIQRMTEIILHDLGTAFEPVAPIEFTLERLETNPRFAAIMRPANAAIHVRLRINIDGRGGRADLVLPYATLEPIRELLLQQFMGEKFGHDSIWENHLATELWSTQIELEAILDEQLLSLQRVMELKVGQTLMLNTSPNSPVELRCGGVPLLRGRMGRTGHLVAVRIEGRAADGTARKNA